MSVKMFPRYIRLPDGKKMLVHDHHAMSAYMGAEYGPDAELVVDGVPSQVEQTPQSLEERTDFFENTVDPEPAPTPVAFQEVVAAVEEPKKRRGRPSRSAFPAVGEVRDAEE